jgi:transcription termination/antitermination protein NusG
MKKVTWPDKPAAPPDDHPDLVFVLVIGAVIALMDLVLQTTLVRLPQTLFAKEPAKPLEHRWYAVQTTSGHENKVARLLQRKIDSDPAEPEDAAIRQALVPTQEVVEIKNGKKVTVERKIFPGYVLVEMVASQDTLHDVNAVQGVIKFVGKEREPMPLRPDEVKRLLGIADEAESGPVKEEIPFLVGRRWQITDGPVRGVQRYGRGSAAGQGQGARVGQPVRAAHLGGAGLPAAARLLARGAGRGPRGRHTPGTTTALNITVGARPVPDIPAPDVRER